MIKKDYKSLKQYAQKMKKANINKIAFNTGTNILDIVDN